VTTQNESSLYIYLPPISFLMGAELSLLYPVYTASGRLYPSALPQYRLKRRRSSSWSRMWKSPATDIATEYEFSTDDFDTT